MELSSISSETNSAVVGATITTTNTTTVPSSQMPSPATTTNASPLLFSNDNLQSHRQKSPTILINNDNIKTPQLNVETNNLATNNNLTSDNSSFENNNRNDTKEIYNCYKNHDQFNRMSNVSMLDSMQSEKRGVDHVGAFADTDNLKRDIDFTLATLLSRIETECNPLETESISQSTVFCSTNEPVTKVALITPVMMEDDTGVTKDIVTLRNLEITPPPQPVKEPPFDETPTTTATTTPDVQCTVMTKSGRKRKIERTHSETTEQSDESANSRSKRQRKQTELFQVISNDTPRSRKPKDINERSASSRKTSISSSKKVQSKIPRFQHKHGHKCERKQLPTRTETRVVDRQSTERQRDFQDVICYEKNDYLAIRNEENTFYLCQLTENVRVQRPFVKIRWLDTLDNGKTYFITSHYDKIPQKSIIMPVTLNKEESRGGKGKPIFSIDEQIRDTVMDRLKRSLNIPTEAFE